MNRHSTNINDKAVALRYKDKSDRAPQVIAKGSGFVARQIMELAKENGIPIHQDEDLVQLLGQIDIDREIPPELYSAVAEILSWIYRANKEFKKEIMGQ